ncbi:MAG: 6,7-dimethyl-8-ribityllumazine synthase [bacterium]
MVKEIKGSLEGKGFKIGIVLAEFNDFITTQLKRGAIDTLEKHGVENEDISVYRVPGSFEIPGMARRLRDSNEFDGIICLGAVIRGETPHFDYVAGEVTRGVGQLSFESDIPVIYGVITTDNLDQAVERAGVKAGNKGSEASRSLIQMINTCRQV